tara:strand:+ start:9659 stop:10588 length:930 start_codon:yes stop_codon:yes gene_type:complete
MTEAVAVDSAASSEQPDSNDSGSESVNEMGMGFVEPDIGTSDSDSQSAEHPTAAGNGTDAGNNTAAQTTTTTSPAAAGADGSGDGLRLADYTRKMQAVADERRAVEADRAAVLETQQQLNQHLAQYNQSQQVDPVQALAAQLGPDEARGLTVVDQLVQERAQEIADRQVAAALEPYKPYLDQLSTTTAAVDRVTQAQTAQARSEANAQIEAAEAIFGRVDDWDPRHRAVAAALTRTENADTGEAYTVAEAMALATKRALNDRTDAIGQQRALRNTAKRASAAQSGSPGIAESGGSITREQALAEIEATL